MMYHERRGTVMMKTLLLKCILENKWFELFKPDLDKHKKTGYEGSWQEARQEGRIVRKLKCDIRSSKQKNWQWRKAHWLYGRMLRERKKKMKKEKDREMAQRNENKSFIIGYSNPK